MVAKYMFLAVVTVLFASHFCVKAVDNNITMEGLIEALRAYDRSVKEYEEAPEARQHGQGSCLQLHKGCTIHSGRSYNDPNSQQEGSPTGRGLFSGLIYYIFGSSDEDEKEKDIKNPAPVIPVPVWISQQCCGNGKTLICNGQMCIPCVKKTFVQNGGYYLNEPC